MAAGLHPEIEVLGELIAQHNKSAEEITSATGIKSARFNLIMSGKADMTVNEEELICRYLGISVREVVLKGIELRERRKPPTLH